MYFTTVGKLLTVDDFREVYGRVYPQRLRWRPIGLCLGVHATILENTEYQYFRNTEQCLEKTLLDWLRRPTLRPTWQALINALKDKIVGEEGAAEALLNFLKSKAANG